jgi:hypothetical protein
LLQKKLGFRMLMDVIPLDASLVKGSHGCRPKSKRDWPVFIGASSSAKNELRSSDIYHLIADSVLQ